MDEELNAQERVAEQLENTATAITDTTEEAHDRGDEIIQGGVDKAKEDLSSLKTWGSEVYQSGIEKVNAAAEAVHDGLKANGKAAYDGISIAVGTGAIIGDAAAETAGNVRDVVVDGVQQAGKNIVTTVEHAGQALDNAGRAVGQAVTHDIPKAAVEDFRGIAEGTREVVDAVVDASRTGTDRVLDALDPDKDYGFDDVVKDNFNDAAKVVGGGLDKLTENLSKQFDAESFKSVFDEQAASANAKAADVAKNTSAPSAETEVSLDPQLG